MPRVTLHAIAMRAPVRVRERGDGNREPRIGLVARRRVVRERIAHGRPGGDVLLDTQAPRPRAARDGPFDSASPSHHGSANSQSIQGAHSDVESGVRRRGLVKLVGYVSDLGVPKPPMNGAAPQSSSRPLLAHDRSRVMDAGRARGTSGEDVGVDVDPGERDGVAVDPGRSFLGLWILQSRQHPSNYETERQNTYNSRCTMETRTVKVKALVPVQLHWERVGLMSGE